jgi:TP901 family phage tail tape measure protein
MAVPDFIIKYGADLADVKSQIAQVQTLNARMAQTLGSGFQEATRVIGTSLDSVSRSTFTKNIAGETKNFTQEVLKSGTIVQLANGQYQQYIETNTLLNGQLVKTTGALSDVTGQYSRTSVEAEKNNKSTKNLSDNIKALGERALLTIPIWLALRGSITGMMSTISNGLINIQKFDESLQKVRRNMQGTPEEVGKNFDILKQKVTEFSLQTGKSTEEIAEAIKKFATIGFSFEDSLTGGLEATKLAVLLFGDASDTANAFARALKILIDTSDGAKSSTEQMAEAFALTATLEKTNQFEITEVTQSLEKFASTAKTVGLSMEQTLKLLATLGTASIAGARGGTLLRTSLRQLLSNLDQVASMLNIQVNPKLDNTFSLLMKVIDALQLLDAQGKVGEELNQALSAIFGGVRGAEAISALVALNKQLKENIAIKPDVDAFNKSFEFQTKQLYALGQQFHNTNKEIGKAFVTGLVGGKDFNTSLDRINDTLRQLQKNADDFGRAINSALGAIPINALARQFDIKADTENLKASLQEQVTQALHGQLDVPQMQVVLTKLQASISTGEDLGLTERTRAEAILAIRQRMIKTEEDINVEKIRQMALTEEQKQKEVETNSILLKREEFLKLEDQIRKELQSSGSTEVETEQKILAVRQLSGKFIQKDIVLQKELIGHLQRLEQIELQRNRNKGLIDNQIEYLRLQGATAIQVLQARNELEKQAGINQDVNSLLNKQIELEKAITAEKIKQTNFSSDAVKLFQIAQKEGVQVAQVFADFLQGNIPITAFEPGGALDNLNKILEANFASEAEQARAFRFFTQGAGKNIAFPEVQLRNQAVQGITPTVSPLTVAPSFTTNVGGVTLQVSKVIDKNTSAQEILNMMLDALKKNPELTQEINNLIEEF